jgi:hypothetical protein
MQGLNLSQSEFEEAMAWGILPPSATAPIPAEKAEESGEDQFIKWKGPKTERNLESVSTATGETAIENGSTGADLKFARTMPGHYQAQFVFG